MRIILIVIALLGIAGSNANAQSANDISAQLEDLGIPSKKAGYAKNIWDLQLWNNKIYVGTGNSSNGGPNTNAGPIPIISLNPQTKQFTEEPITLTDGTVKLAVDEEQIDIIRIVNGALIIPGHDSKESWSFGNYYRLEANGWIKYRNIPGGIHVYDLIDYQGQYFAALGTDGNNTLAISSNNGQSWLLQNVPINAKVVSGSCVSGVDMPTPVGAYRIYGFFTVSGELYANTGTVTYIECVNNLWKYTFSLGANIWHWDGTAFVATTLNPYGNISANRVVRSIIHSGKTVYIAAIGVNDHQWDPKALFYLSNLSGTATQISLPTNSIPWDILVRGSTLYVLGQIKIDATHHIITVNKSSDLTNWTEILRFNADTFARSFEELDGYFYFGLGSDTTTIPTDTGKILRVKLVNSTPLPTNTSKPGDANSDNKVDGIDYIIWLNHYNQNATGANNGDFNNSGKVDGVDYVIWLNNYGK